MREEGVHGLFARQAIAVGRWLVIGTQYSRMRDWLRMCVLYFTSVLIAMHLHYVCARCMCTMHAYDGRTSEHRQSLEIFDVHRA